MKQWEKGWKCPVCNKVREKDGGPDPCLGMLPGVRYACCGHGGAGHGYVSFTNGTVIRFDRLYAVERWADEEMKERLRVW